MKSSIRVVPEPIVRPVYEPEVHIVNAYVDSVVDGEETKWFLHLVNHDGQVYDYKLLIGPIQ